MPHPEDFSRRLNVDTFGKDLIKIRAWFDDSKLESSKLDNVDVLGAFTPQPTPEDMVLKEIDKIVKETKKYFPDSMSLPIYSRTVNNPPKRKELLDKIKYHPSSVLVKRKRDSLTTTTTTNTTTTSSNIARRRGSRARKKSKKNNEQSPPPPKAPKNNSRKTKETKKKEAKVTKRITFAEIEEIAMKLPNNVLKKVKETKEKVLKTFCCTKSSLGDDNRVVSRTNFLTPAMKRQRLIEDDQHSEKITTSDTFLIRVAVYQSLNTYNLHRSRRQEFLVTNNNYLSDLLDHPSLSCLQDEIDGLGDEDEDEDEMLTNPRHLFIEGMFSFEYHSLILILTRTSSLSFSGTFYTEDPESCKPTLEWLQSQPDLVKLKKEGQLEKPMFKITKLKNIRFGDLNIRLGARYLYKHQIDCEHIIVFQDIRLFHQNDDLDSLSYPMHVHQYKMNRRNCGCCEYTGASMVCYNDVLSPSSPFFYCESCFEKLHCDENGDIIENICGPEFKWYPYIHD